MPRPGDRAPHFAGETVNGLGRFDLADHEGQVVVVIFAGLTWCPPCQRKAEYLQRVADDVLDSQFVMVSVGDDPDALTGTLGRFGIRFPVLRETPALRTDYDVGGVPMSFVLARDQTVCFVHRGASPEQGFREDITHCADRPYIPPEDRAGCAMAVRTFIGALGNARIVASDGMREHGDQSPAP